MIADFFRCGILKLTNRSEIEILLLVFSFVESVLFVVFVRSLHYLCQLSPFFDRP